LARGSALEFGVRGRGSGGGFPAYPRPRKAGGEKENPPPARGQGRVSVELD